MLKLFRDKLRKTIGKMDVEDGFPGAGVPPSTSLHPNGGSRFVKVGKPPFSRSRECGRNGEKTELIFLYSSFILSIIGVCPHVHTHLQTSEAT